MTAPELLPLGVEDVARIVASPEWETNHARALIEARVRLGMGQALSVTQTLDFNNGKLWLIERGLASEWPRPLPEKPAPPGLSGSVLSNMKLVGSKTVPKPSSRLISTCIDDIESEEVDWLWPGRIPRGRLSILLGRQGKGKSTLIGWLASAVSAGLPWPDSPVENEPGTVLMLQAEEHVAQDIRPRLEAMGACFRKVHVVTAVDRGDGIERTPSLAQDVKVLTDEVNRHGDVKLIIVDPLGHYVQGISGYNSSEVRGYMDPLIKLAEKTGIAVVLVMHPSKDQEKDILDRASDSGAFTQMARMAWYYSDDPKDKSRRLLSLMKGNILGATRTAISVAYHKRRLVWRPDPVHLDAFEVDHMLQRAARDEKLHGKRGPDASVTNKAKEFIVQFLGRGPTWVSVVLDQAETVGIKESSFRKGLKRLIEDDGQVEKFKGDDGRHWIRLTVEPPASTPIIAALAERLRNEPGSAWARLLSPAVG